MKLSELIKGLDVTGRTGAGDPDVTGIAYHTGGVAKGCAFVAIRGSVADGHDHIGHAAALGAAVIVSSRPVSPPGSVTNVVVKDARLALARMSARFFGCPSDELKLVGITGTNGKTTVTYLLESIWKACGMKTGIIGTVNYRYSAVTGTTGHTTPESHDIQRLFRAMADDGVDAVGMEVSSHALDQGRVSGCSFDGAVFTNLTQDHLDYHIDMERYKDAKKLLFSKFLAESPKEGKWALINADDAAGREFAKGLSCRVLSYSLLEEADFCVGGLRCGFDGIEMGVKTAEGRIGLKSRLIGRHNASNILAALGACLAMGLPAEKIREGIAQLARVPGRLDVVKNSRNLKVVVDYAHTPDAIKNVTAALRDLRPARLITVFGCGGDRDRTKRPLMGFEAAIASDAVIVTSDNPRSEDPQKIIDEIVAGIKKAGIPEVRGNGGGYAVEADRRAAIRRALAMAGPDDVVLIAGKGHEDYQIVGRERLPFDDAKVVQEEA